MDVAEQPVERAGAIVTDVVARNNVVLAGNPDGPPMMFAHGFGCDQNMWRFLTPSFADDHRIVLFDYVGAGRSDLGAYDPRRYGSLDGYADDVLEICEALDLREVVFVGHSVSSMIGVLAAARQPERFSRLVLIGPSPRYIDDEGYNGGFSRTDPDIARAFARVTFLSDNRADLARVDVPALVLQCSQDVIAPESVGQYVHRHLKGSELVRLSATGHCPNLSAPDETIAAIKDFLVRAEA